MPIAYAYGFGVWKRSRRGARKELAAMLMEVAGLPSAEAEQQAAELAPLAGGDTLTLVTDWVFWSELPEQDRPAFEDFERHAVFDSWDARD